MASGATKREILEKRLEQRLQDPKTETLISLPLEFLEDITCRFSTERELGRGAYGVVYKGVLRSGKAIAVKKIFDAHLLGNDNQVENEIICLTEVRHQNIVQLVGYCVETKSEVVKHSGKHVMAEKRTCLLCFEFLCNGSLDEHLSDDTSGLDWDKRYKIIRGVCRGLHYLHDKCRIAHRDLKPQNILMDDKMMPKIADFGLSRLLGEQKSKTVTANCAGTLGYMAKEYIDKGIISYKADIFSLGVIIIEIITGHMDYSSIGDERTETSLKHYIDKVVGSWRNRVEITPMHIQQVEQCISIALECVEPESSKRPTSLHIVQNLNAEELNSTPPQNSPIGEEEDRTPQNLQSQVTMNIINIPKTISAINGLNECANLFQWVTSVISSLTSRSNDTQKERIQQRDICQLHSDLQCLTDTLPAMYNLINRAEWRIHYDFVADLLSILKDAVYDAEDLLEEFRWFEKKVSAEGNATSAKPVIKFFQSVTQGSFNKVIGIQKRLNNVSEQLEKQGLLLESPRFDKSSRPETSFFPTEEKIMGRDREKKKLIMLLGVSSGRKKKISGVSSSTNNQVYATIDSNEATIVNVRVLPIVGIGGVGKTTLAQDICSHSKVKGHFDLIIWICVSDDFNVNRLTKEAIEQTSSSTEVLENGNLTSLQRALEKSVKEKRFLIVLDDIWDAKVEHWKQFFAPFKIALQGSMMLVTTRSQKVADVVRTMDPFPLEGLKEDVFWKFFKFCVFGRNSSNIDPKLEQIGEKILPKLRGSPLAAKTLGRLLGMSLELAHWDTILKSQLWELEQKETDILPALRLSYMYLPLYLKRCFSFCAVYPKDYKFKKEDLVEIWVAEGLVKHRPNISLYETGGQYFEELAHLSFFQKYGQKYPQAHTKYVIHDLMHDMAQLVSKDECFIVKEKKDLHKIPKNVRHLSVLKGGDVHCSDLLEHDMAQHRKLRTLFFHLSLNSKTGNTVREKWCTELLCMRVMVCSVSKWGLPGSISNMKLLRYLKIVNSSLCKSLPSTFCCLSNMEIFYAKNWKIGIPSGFVKLINLQKFESEQFQFCHIHSLAGKEQRRLKLENYGKSPPHGFDAQNLPNITSLVIGYWYNDNCTFRSLTDIKIVGCQNLSLEQFLQPAYLPIIRKIEISQCLNLELIPAERFGDLRFLEILKVINCRMIKSQRLCAQSLKECYLDRSGNLGGNIECTSLTNLRLMQAPLQSIELQMWNLPSLQKLNINWCPSLTIIKDSEPISLDLSLCGTRSRMVRFPFLTHLGILHCNKLETIDDLLHLHLKNLEIILCRSLNWQSGVLLPSSLQHLKLWKCGDFPARFPSCLEKPTSLESLVISSKFIVSVPGHLWNSNLKSLRRLKFYDCPNLKSIGGPDAIAHIRDLSIDKCPKLKEIDQPLKKGSKIF